MRGTDLRHGIYAVAAADESRHKTAIRWTASSSLDKPQYIRAAKDSVAAILRYKGNALPLLGTK